MRALAISIVGLIVLGCGGPPPGPTRAPIATSPSPGTSAAPGTAVVPSPGPSTAALNASKVPPGRIAYIRVDSNDVERYFTVSSTGSDERLLFETQYCACIRWSPDGSQIWTVTETDGVLRFTTMDPEGGHVVIHTPKIETLSLAPGFGSADGRHIAFFGWDDTEPQRAGLWAASSDLSDLHYVTGLPEGVLGVDPIGMSANGSHIYFNGDLGENTDNPFHHAGNVYVIGSDGKGLRQLNPVGTKSESTGSGVSADGRMLAFTAWQAGRGDDGNALFIVDGVDGAVRQVTDWTPGLWGAAWSPSGEWIGVTQELDGRVASLIRPDGTGLRTVADPASGEPVFGPAWSPDGTHFLVRRGSQHANDLWVMDLEGHYVWQVTHRPASYDIYQWAGPRRNG